jgi:hypothetical protein
VQGKTFFVGDAVGLYRKHIEEAYQKDATKSKNTCQCRFADEKFWFPKAKVMAELAFKRFQDKKYDDAAKLLPIYLYPQDCQVSPAVSKA